MGQVRDDAMERLGQYRVELTGGGASWGPGGVGDEMQSVCASFGEDSGAGDGHGRKAVWDWPGWSAEEARVSGDGWV